MDTAATRSIAILGAGSWGTALAILLARNGHSPRLWGPDATQLSRWERARENTDFLPGIKFPAGVSVCADLAALVQGTSSILVAVPSHAFRAVLTTVAIHLQPGAVLAWATKGLEPGTSSLLSEVAGEVLKKSDRLAVISGPTFAREVAQGLPTAFTVAADTAAIAEVVAGWLRGERTRVYVNTDIKGVQLGGAIKNVIAIAAGISDGLGFGANARAALITRGLTELMRLGVAMGGNKETFMGLAGAGDLILTCTDNLSRNRRLGLGLGQGGLLSEVMREIGQEVEGVATAHELHQLAARFGVEMPISEQVYRVLYEKLPPQAAVEALLKREPRIE